MKKAQKNSVFYILIAIMFALLIWFEQVSKPVNWELSFSKKSKDPYGSTVVFDILQDVFPNEEIVTSKYSFFYFLRKNPNTTGNLILIDNYIELTPTDLDTIKAWVSEGNNCFLSSRSLSDSLSEILGLKKNYNVNYNNLNRSADSLAYYFTSKKVKHNGPFYFSNAWMSSEYLPDSTSKSTTLGYFDNEKPNFTCTNYGKGKIFFHSLPLLFTNYNILSNDGKEYIERVFSHIPPGTIIWDELYKPGKNADTPLRYFVQTPPLKAALYLAVFLLIFYAIFQSKRRQTKIPVITPLRNSTVDFAETIGQLYLYKHDNRDIILKQTDHLNDYVMSKFYISLSQMNDEKAESLSSKTGIPTETIIKISGFRALTLKAKSISDDDLGKVTNEINDFRNKCEKYGNI